MDKQAREAREQMKQLGKKDKWVNFWYYYRTHVVVAVIAVILIVFTAVECAKRIDYDLNISYYSAMPISEEAVNKLTEELKKNVEDINFNGQTDVFIASCFADPEQVSEQTQAVMMKLSAELAAGDAMGYLVDETYLEILNKAYAECFGEIILISDIPEIRDIMGISEEHKLYWATKMLYENEKDDEKKALAHENAVKAEEYFKSFKK